MTESMKYYESIRRKYPEAVSKDQFYQIAHISKATALHLLQNGLVPCKDTGKKTRRYTIRTDDIIFYLIDRELHPEVYRAPDRWYQERSGHYNSRVTYRNELTRLSEEERASFRKYMEDEFCQYKDIACKRASAYQNGTTKHCLQKLLHPSELSIPLAAVILDSSKIFQEAVAVTAKQVQIGDRSCRIYGADCAEYLLLQMTDEHELQRMDNEVAAIAQGAAHPFLFATVPVKNWNDELSPWEAPAVWGKESFGCNAADTLRFLMEQVIPTLKQRFALPENVKIILGGYSLAGLFALWASTQTDLFYGVVAASPSVWFPGWMEFEQQHPIQAQHIYLSLGDKEKRTKNAVMAAVGDNIRTLHSRLAERGADCTLEWNSGGHFKDADLRTAKAFRWVMEEHA